MHNRELEKSTKFHRQHEKNWIVRISITNLFSVSWIHYQHLDLTSGKLSKICLAKVLIQMLLWSVVILFTMTRHQKQIFLTNILPSFPQHQTPYSLKYFLDFIGVLIYLFLPSQLSPVMFTMYCYLVILINREGWTTCLTDFSKIALNLLPLH